jgi:hypothetical protein
MDQHVTKTQRKEVMRKGTTRLYLDRKHRTYITVYWEDATHEADVPLSFGPAKLKRSKRGYPFECVAAINIGDLAQHDPKAFKHRVTGPAYVIRSIVYLPFRNHPGGIPSHVKRYDHNFILGSRKFDKYTKQRFLEEFGERGFLMKLKPPRVHGTRAGNRGRNFVHGKRTKTISRGAETRWRDAGIHLPQRKNADD